MAESVVNAVQAAIKAHPNWNQLEIFNSLKGKYDAMSLGQVIANEYGKAQRAKDEAAKAARDKANQQAASPITGDQYAAQIAARAKGSDPTASGTVTPLVISPLTGQPQSATGGMQYSSKDWQDDFTGPNARLRRQLDPVTKQAYVGKFNGFGYTKVAVLGDPNIPGNYTTVDFSSALDNIIKEAASQKGGILALKNRLAALKLLSGTAAKRSISQGNTPDQDFGKALFTYVENLTMSNFYQGSSNPLNIQSFNTAIAGAPSTSLAGTKTSTFVELTRKEAAASELSAFMQEYLGEGPSSKEIDDYTKALNDAEKAAPRKTTTTTDTAGAVKSSTSITGGLSTEQKQGIMTGLLLSRLKASNVDPTAISKSSGLIARQMDALKETAGNYGVRLDDKMALSKVMAELKPGGDIKNQQEVIKQTAKAQYKHLASAIDQGVTVKDVADQFNYYRNKTLETVGATDVFDPDIQAALQGDGNKLMNLNDFIIKMKNKPEWAMTTNAREEASNYAMTILKNFGFMG